MTAPPPSTPTADAPDPTSRFTDRVDLYVKYRPSYPAATLEILRREGFLSDGMTVADVGSGTGISSAMFLRAGCRVIGVEPNAAMRAAAEQALAANHAFSSIAGSAEASTLPFCRSHRCAAMVVEPRSMARPRSLPS